MASEIKSGDILNLESINSNKKIYAGPGAGKTYFLINNIKEMFKRDTKIYGSKSKKILCITYTNSAVDEIKSRLEGYENNIEICTIHSFIIKYIIQFYQDELKKIMKEDYDIEVKGNKRISSQIEGIGILHGQDKQQIFQYINSNLGTSDEINYPKKTMGEVRVNIEKYITEDKKELICSNKIIESHKNIIKKYLWDVVRKLNHDEILYFGYRILERNPTILYAIRAQFPYIFVDEFQDTNPLQTKMLLKICEKISKITVIGDVAQSIYSFQGARPTQFTNFSLHGMKEYEIKGNRRSTSNIVHMCNYIRRNDKLEQVSIKEYKNEEEKQKAESKLVHFISNSSNEKVKSIIKDVLKSQGAIITRTWAYAFNYIMDISETQKDILKKIYSSYYASPIDIRYEIVESSSILWVKAFKFLIYLNEAYKTRTINNVLNAISVYGGIDKKNLERFFSISIITKLNRFLESLFKDVNNNSKVIEIINDFNNKLSEEYNKEIKDFLSKISNMEDFRVEVFSEEDNQTFINLIIEVEWNTAYALFKDVFSKDSKYMTVHQAKGLEWQKVFVSINATRGDSTSFANMFKNSNILSETPSDEFTRIFYVACSRAIEELYIAIDDVDKPIIQQKLDKYIEKKNINKFYDFI